MTLTRESNQSCVAALVFVGIVALSLTIVVLWARFGPFNSQTPRVVVVLALILSVICVLIWFIINIIFGSNEWMWILLIIILVSCGGLITGQTGRVIEEVFGDSNTDSANYLLAIGVVFGIATAGQFMSEIGEVVYSYLWQVFRSHLKKRKYLIAIVLLILAAIIFLLSLILEGIQ